MNGYGDVGVVGELKKWVTDNGCAGGHGLGGRWMSECGWKWVNVGKEGTGREKERGKRKMGKGKERMKRGKEGKEGAERGKENRERERGEKGDGEEGIVVGN